jgi:putative peptidoglycan lipid II flippase
LIALLATPLAGVVAAGLDPDDRARVAAGIRELSPLALLFGLAGVGRAWLDARGKLWVGATFPMVRSLTIGVVVLLFWSVRPPRLGDAVLGALLGAVLACAWSIVIAVRDAGPLSDMQTGSTRRNHDVRDVVTITAGSVASQSADIVDKSLASHLGPGQVSALSIASSIIQIPVALFVSASTTVAFPEFARLRALKAQHDIRDALSGYWKLALLTLTPVVLVAVLMPHQVVTAAFGVKRLGLGGAALTASCLAALALGQLPYVTALIERQYLLAGSRYRLTTLSALISIATKIGASIVLVRLLGVIGLALATSIGHMMSLALYSTLTAVDLVKVRAPGEAND